jgi:gluconolactonase
MQIHKLASAIYLVATMASAQSQTAIPDVIAVGTQPELVQEGFTFTEGPVGVSDGGIFFTDVRASKLHRLDAAGKVTTVREASTGANGLTFNKAGDLYAAEGVPGKRISRANQTGQAVTVLDKVSGQLLGAPNDLIMDAKGGIYFTDPGTQRIDAPDRRGDVYYLPPGAKEPIRLDDQLKFPNGLTLTLDGKTLLVDDTVGVNIWAYDVQADGSVKNKRVFAAVPQLTDGKSFADGMCLDTANRVYVTTGAGVQVFDRSGKFLGLIKIPRQPSNCAFSGQDKKTLYVTAREGVYRIKMLAQGPSRPGK